MGLFFEQGKEGLAQDGGVSIVHLAEEQIAAHGFVGLRCQELVNQHHLAEGRGCLSQRQVGLEGKRLWCEASMEWMA